MTDGQIMAAFGEGSEEFEFLLLTEVGVLKRFIPRDVGPFGFISSDLGDTFFNGRDLYTWDIDSSGSPYLRNLVNPTLAPGTPLTFHASENVKGRKAFDVLLWDVEAFRLVWRKWRLRVRDTRPERLISGADETTLWEGRDLAELKKKFPVTMPKRYRSMCSEWPFLQPETIYLYPVGDYGDRALWFEYQDSLGNWWKSETDPRLSEEDKRGVTHDRILEAVGA